MLNSIDSYLAELNRHLVGKLPLNRIDQIAKEAEGHLSESVQRKICTSVDESAATQSAIEAYGSPEKVALAFLQSSRRSMWGLNPIWWAGLGTVITIYSWNFHWLTLRGYFDHFRDTWQNGIAGLAGLIGLALVVFAVRAGFRSLRLSLIGITIAAALLSIPVVSLWMIPEPGFAQGISRFHLDRDLPIAEKSVEHIKAYKNYIARGMSEYAAARSPTDLSPDLQNPSLAARKLETDRLNPAMLGSTCDRGGAFVVPRRYGAFIEANGRTTVLETMATFEDAKKAWSQTGPKAMSELEVNLADFNGLVRNATAAKNGRLFFFEPNLYLDTIIGTILLLPLFLLLDCIAVLSVRPRNRKPQVVIA